MKSLKLHEQDTILVIDPDLMIDKLPQPYRMIDKLVKYLIDHALDQISKKKTNLINKPKHDIKTLPQSSFVSLREKNGIRCTTVTDDGKFLFYGTSTGHIVCETPSISFSEKNERTKNSSSQDDATLNEKLTDFCEKNMDHPTCIHAHTSAVSCIASVTRKSDILVVSVSGLSLEMHTFTPGLSLPKNTAFSLSNKSDSLTTVTSTGHLLPSLQLSSITSTSPTPSTTSTTNFSQPLWKSLCKIELSFSALSCSISKSGKYVAVVLSNNALIVLAVPLPVVVLESEANPPSLTASSILQHNVNNTANNSQRATRHVQISSSPYFQQTLGSTPSNSKYLCVFPPQDNSFLFGYHSLQIPHFITPTNKSISQTLATSIENPSVSLNQSKVMKKIVAGIKTNKQPARNKPPPEKLNLSENAKVLNRKSPSKNFVRVPSSSPTQDQSSVSQSNNSPNTNPNQNTGHTSTNPSNNSTSPLKPRASTPERSISPTRPPTNLENNKVDERTSDLLRSPNESSSPILDNLNATTENINAIPPPKNSIQPTCYFVEVNEGNNNWETYSVVVCWSGLNIINRYTIMTEEPEKEVNTKERGDKDKERSISQNTNTKDKIESKKFKTEFEWTLKSSINCTNLSYSSEILAVGLSDGTIAIFDVLLGLFKEIVNVATHLGHQSSVSKIIFCGDRNMVSLGTDGLVLVYQNNSNNSSDEFTLIERFHSTPDLLFSNILPIAHSPAFITLAHPITSPNLNSTKNINGTNNNNNISSNMNNFSNNNNHNSNSISNSSSSIANNNNSSINNNHSNDCIISYHFISDGFPNLLIPLPIPYISTTLLTPLLNSTAESHGNGSNTPHNHPSPHATNVNNAQQILEGGSQNFHSISSRRSSSTPQTPNTISNSTTPRISVIKQINPTNTNNLNNPNNLNNHNNPNNRLSTPITVLIPMKLALNFEVCVKGDFLLVPFNCPNTSTNESGESSNTNANVDVDTRTSATNLTSDVSKSRPRSKLSQVSNNATPTAIPVTPAINTHEAWEVLQLIDLHQISNSMTSIFKTANHRTVTKPQVSPSFWAFQQVPLYVRQKKIQENWNHLKNQASRNLSESFSSISSINNNTLNFLQSFADCV